MGANRTRPDPVSEARQDAATLRYAAAQLRAYRNRLEVEGRAMRDPHDQADNREHMEGVLSAADLCNRLADDHEHIANAAESMAKVMMRHI